MRETLTSREVVGVLKAISTPRAALVRAYIERLHAALDDVDGEDFFGTEGWRKYLLKEDF